MKTETKQTKYVQLSKKNVCNDFNTNAINAVK